jgi:hypothetical protein
MNVFNWMARWLASAIAVVTLAGCAVVDQYSGRAVAYNIEAEHAQEQALLLNIVRAYLQRPMQFTTVSNIVGTASASGAVGYTAPVNIPFRPAINGSSIAAIPNVLNAWTLGGSMSGGPTFTVPVLDTQEFYQGILKEIPSQLWNFYEQQGYSRSLLFNLFVERLVLKRQGCQKIDHQETCEIIIRNDVEDERERKLFQAVSEYLLFLGLTTEREKEESLLKPDPVCRFTDAQQKTLSDDKIDLKGNPADEQTLKEATNKEKRLEAAKATKGSDDEKVLKIAKEAINIIRENLDCQSKRIIEATNVNVKISGSLGGLTGQSGGATPGGAGGAASAGGDTSPSKYSLCFRPRSEAIAYVSSRYLCGMADLSQYRADEETAKLDKGIKKRLADKLKEYRKMSCPNEEEELPFVEGKAVFEVGPFFWRILDRLVPKLGRAIEETAHCYKVVLDIHLRSTEGLFRYLGAVAREESYGNNRQVIKFFEGGYHERYYDGAGGYNDPWECVEETPDISENMKKKCHPIFLLNVGANAGQTGAFLSTFYDGQFYSIQNGGTSGQVLEILKQALALSSSSKSLPQSNVVSIVGGQ